MARENLGLPIALQTQFENCELLLDNWLARVGLTRREFLEYRGRSSTSVEPRPSRRYPTGGQERRN